MNIINPIHNPLRQARTDSNKLGMSQNCKRQYQPQALPSEFKTLVLLKLLDPLTLSHSIEVAQHAYRIMRALGKDSSDSRSVFAAALLHDVGKIGVERSIIEKPGTLDEIEWEKMKEHSVIGYEILIGYGYPTKIADIVQAHHEKFDGTGYPFGLAGTEIPFGARVIAVADSFDAMTSERAYRPPATLYQSVQELRRLQGQQFDPSIVEMFIGTLRLPEVKIESRSSRISSRGFVSSISNVSTPFGVPVFQSL